VEKETYGPGTLAVWAGEESAFEHGTTVAPISLGVTYEPPDVDQWLDVVRGKRPGYIYGRSSNPTVNNVERKVAALDGAEAAISFSTGMAAMFTTFLALLGPGSRFVALADSYGGTRRVCLDVLRKFGVDVKLFRATDLSAMKSALAEGAALLHLETPTNPMLEVLDIADLAQQAHRHGALVSVDNTLATPINQQPLALGADIVAYSATKFLNGHSDAMGGFISGSSELVKRVHALREITGAALDPHAAFLIGRGLKTLELRVQRQNDNAAQLAKFLLGHPRIEKVVYPGLPSHSTHEIARRQMRGFGGLVSFQVRGGLTEAARFLKGLKLAHRAASLGSVASLAGYVAATSHAEVTEDDIRRIGLDPSMIRFSVGIENGADLVADVAAALE
jgi:cystathionine gamma-synthase